MSLSNLDSENSNWHVLPISASTSEELDGYLAGLSSRLKLGRESRIEDVARDLQLSVENCAFRKILVCRSCTEALELLEKPRAGQVFSNNVSAGGAPVVFLFPGQGSQYLEMGKRLYETKSVFRDSMNRCSGLLEPLLGLDINELIYPDSSSKGKAERLLNETRYTQPAIFCIEYALAKLWKSWGVKPVSMIGHSVGEYVAACLSGVISLNDALFLVSHRAKLIQGQPSGSMLAVRLGEEDLVLKLDERLSIAAVNGPRSCVVSGPSGVIESFQERLALEKIDSIVLRTSHAFHSVMMKPVLKPFVSKFEHVSLLKPKIPFVSNVTGKWITQEDAMSPNYWAKHIRRTVRFMEGLGELLKESQGVLLEVGPGRSLGQFSRLNPAFEKGRLVLSTIGSWDTENKEVCLSLGRIWLSGVDIDWEAHAARQKQSIGLPDLIIEIMTIDTSSIQCEIVANPSKSNWDCYTKSFENSDYFHKSNWANVLIESYSHVPIYFVFRLNGVVVGMLPIMEVDSILTGKRGVSLPFTDCCPILMNDDCKLTEKFIEHALKVGRERNWDYLDLRLNSALSKRVPSLMYYSHRLDLTPDETELKSRCASSSLRSVRKAISNKVEIRFLDGVDGAKEYYRLHCITRKRLGLPPQSWRFFELLSKASLVGENGFVSIASIEGRAIAGAVFLIDEQGAHYKFGASDHRYQSLRGNNLVMWKSICHLKRRGAQSLCMGRTSLHHEGLRKFKLGWGCRERSSYYYRIRPKGGEAMPMIDRTSGFHTELFQKLPIPVLRLVGKLGYPHQS